MLFHYITQQLSLLEKFIVCNRYHDGYDEIGRVGKENDSEGGESEGWGDNASASSLAGYLNKADTERERQFGDLHAASGEGHGKPDLLAQSGVEVLYDG